MIIGAYNAMPYLTETLNSVVRQSLGRDRLEVITVNDGSTDGTGEELERFAAAYPGLFQVFHQENSGGPAAPRNKGLDHARGRFVFFLDADDFLGDEALERMLTVADKNNTDVVLGKVVGVNGRGVATAMFGHNQARTDVLASRVYRTLSPLKLFRRSLVEKHGLRFPTEYRVYEDQLFVARGYFLADGISVVADYDCLFVVKRDDGDNITSATTDIDRRIEAQEALIELVAEHFPAGPDRDKLTERHIAVDMGDVLKDLVLEPDDELRRAHYAKLRTVLERHCSDALTQRLAPLARLRCALALRGMLDESVELEAEVRREAASGVQHGILVDGERAYAQLPFFRDPERGLPDEIYEITGGIPSAHRLDSIELATGTGRLSLRGHGYLRRIPQDDTGIELLLRERKSGAEHRFPTTRITVPGLGEDHDGGGYDYSGAGFVAEIDLTTAAGDGTRLPRGLWDAFLTVRVQGLTREIRIGNQRLPEVVSTQRTYVVADGDDDIFGVALYYTHPYSNLTVDVGENVHKVPDKLRTKGARWAQGKTGILEVFGDLRFAAPPAGTLGVELRDETGRTVAVPGVVDGGTFSVAVPVHRLALGTWRLAVLLTAGDGVARWTWRVPAQPKLPGGRWRHRGLPTYAKPIEDDGLVLRVGRVAVAKALARRVKRLLP
ncbi:glycosyltransferase [Streptomyces sp. NPDC002867]